jgi:regulatory protein
MKTITAIKDERGRVERIKVYMDDRSSIVLQAKVGTGLKTGDLLSEEHIETLLEADRIERCLVLAGQYLARRPQSEAELTQKLTGRGFDEATVNTALDRLREHGFVNDGAFAEFWIENREYFSPRSQTLTRLELRQKGIGAEIIEDAVDSIDDDASAYEAGMKKAAALNTADYDTFGRRIGAYLERRGFSEETISHTIEQLWHDLRDST